MKKYNVQWREYKEMEVEAENEDEAMDKVKSYMSETMCDMVVIRETKGEKMRIVGLWSK